MLRFLDKNLLVDKTVLVYNLLLKFKSDFEEKLYKYSEKSVHRMLDNAVPPKLR